MLTTIAFIRALNIGTGDGINYTNFASLKVMAHEFTHAVTHHTAELIYEKESGALNESFSDIFAIALDYKVNSTSNWLIGDKVKVNSALRSMSNPKQYGHPDTYHGTNWVNTNVVPHWSNDYGGVHSNSGVQNYWFYLLTVGGSGTNDNGNSYNVNGIGIQKSIAIAFRNLRYELSANSNYQDAMNGSLQAATDLYGYNSQEYISVLNAWGAVGVDPGIPLSASISGPNTLLSSQIGSYTVTPIGGTQPYTIKWYKRLASELNWTEINTTVENPTTIQVSQTTTSSQSLFLKTVITDANSGSYETTKTIQLNVPNLSVSLTGPDFLLSEQTGTYSLSISGGEAPYTILWQKKVSSTPNSGTWQSLPAFNNQNQATVSAKVTSSSTLAVKAIITDANNISSEKIIYCEVEPLFLKNQFSLDNYPNPFNPITNINFTLKERSTVSLVIFNSLGQQVRTLINNQNLSNSKRYTYKWNAENNQGQSVSSGIYFYQLIINNKAFTKKMILMK